MKIYKYLLSEEGKIDTYEGRFGNILCVKEQNDLPHMWVEVDEENFYDKQINILSLGTGWDMEVEKIFKNWEDWKYIGTAIVDGLVWHYYAYEKILDTERNKELRQKKYNATMNSTINNLFEQVRRQNDY